MPFSDPRLGTDAQFRLFVDTVDEYAIFMLAPDGTAATWNAGVGRILGYAEAEFVGRPFDRIFTPEERAHGLPAAEMAAARDTGRAEDERWHVRKDESRFWALGILAPLRDPAGRLVGYVKVIRDRTDQKLMQEVLRNRAEALSAADDRKNLFIATLAHELRNPLAAILTAAELLNVVAGELPKVAGPSRVIGRQAGAIRRLVDDLMDVTRAAAGKVQLDRARVRLESVLGPAVDAVRAGCEARRQALTASVPDAPAWLDADAGRLHQVFVNLLTNASKYTPEGGHISLTATTADGEAVVYVRDDGIGIPGDVQARIFDLFTQADSARPHDQGGLGLGLSLVKGFVELHGGTVQVRSEGPGKGSEFTVRLPLAPGG